MIIKERPRRRRIVAVTAGVLVAAAALGGGIMLAAGDGEQSLSQPPAASKTKAPTTTEPPVITTTTSSTTTTPSTATSDAVPPKKVEAEPIDATKETYSLDRIDPSTYGPLRLRMPKQEALTTGLLGAVEFQDNLCTRYTGTFGGAVVVSNKYGVVDIRVTRPVSTSKGIRIGSIVADVKAAYPATAVIEYRNGLYLVTEPGIMAFDVAGYHMHHTPWPDTGIINRIGIGSQQSDCAGAF
jgi:hypothetical protein